MENRSKGVVADIVNMLSESWKGSLITAGLNAGIFSVLNDTTPVSLAQVAAKLNYDEDKLDKWFYYCENFGIVGRMDGGFTLTPFAKTFMPDSPYKDLLGFMRINDFFMRSAVDAGEFFRKNSSLDKLKDGKITRDYQPKVSDNLSGALIEFFKKYNMAGNDTLLDIGCGIGEFARMIIKEIPELLITGFDSNLFAIEWGKKENRQKGLSEKIKMVVGDAVEDIGEFKDGSFDWVMAINVFHFYPAKHRMDLIENMIRMCKKGVFFTEIIVEKSPLSFAADPLMSLLWGDYTGFFREKDAENINSMIEKKYPGCKVEKHLILQNSSYLIVLTKK